jgi:Amt family ammonium transporter
MILFKLKWRRLSVWFLIGTALVFFMQCGFAMVETGFTRAKNAGKLS